MVSLKKIVLGASIFALPFLSFGQNSVEKLKLGGGVNMDVVNFYDKEKYYSEGLYYVVDNLEKRIIFDGIVSRGKIWGLGMCNNIFLSDEKIDYVRDLPLSEVDSSLLSLKKIIMELDYVDSKELNDYEKVMAMYYVVMSNVKIGDNSSLSTPIENVLNSEEVECRDVVATLYSLFREYDIDARISVGAPTDSTMHTWLNMNIDTFSFDLDPTFYKIFFIPLDKRVEKSYTVEELSDTLLNLISIEDAYLRFNYPEKAAEIDSLYVPKK